MLQHIFSSFFFYFLAVGNLGNGIYWGVLQNLSTTVWITVLPSEDGRPVTKSTDTWDQDDEEPVVDEEGRRELVALMLGTGGESLGVILHGGPPEAL